KLSIWPRVVIVLESIPDVLRTYIRQTVIAAALGMALLFMTVMGFDGLAVGYGQSAGLSDFVLGAFRTNWATITDCNHASADSNRRHKK
ncbi:hypothetical protein TELCIR_18015, partial [Teladorsagia circumcincta]